MAFDKNDTPSIVYVAFVFIMIIIVSVLAILKLLAHKFIFFIILGTYVLGVIFSWTLWFLWFYPPIKDCFCGRQQADESRENTRQPVDVEQPPTIRVQFESARAQRQPYRSTSPRFEMRALPPVKTFGGECAICMEEFKNGDTIQPFGVCIHEFHSSCVQHWFNSGKTTCPLCREDLSTALRTKRHTEGIRI